MNTNDHSDETEDLRPPSWRILNPPAESSSCASAPKNPSSAMAANDMMVVVLLTLIH